MKNWHESQRGYFAGALFDEMEKNTNIWFLTGDLGWHVFDNLFASFPERTINCGASEQAMLDIAVGLSLEGKIPFVYTITPFLLRGYETIRTYINHENTTVHMIGAGRDDDYGKHDGFSHDATDIADLLNPFTNIKQYYPDTKEDVPAVVAQVLSSSSPSFISLRR